MKTTRLRRFVVGLVTPVTLTALMLAAVTGCGGREDEEALRLETERFTAVVVALRQAELEATYSDSAASEFERRRAEILAEHDMTEEELREFLRGRDPEFLEALWDTLNVRLKHVPPRHDPRLEEPADSP